MLVCSLLSKDPKQPLLVQRIYIYVFYGAFTHFIDFNLLSSFTKCHMSYVLSCTTAAKLINITVYLYHDSRLYIVLDFRNR